MEEKGQASCQGYKPKLVIAGIRKKMQLRSEKQQQQNT